MQDTHSSTWNPQLSCQTYLDIVLVGRVVQQATERVKRVPVDLSGLCEARPSFLKEAIVECMVSACEFMSTFDTLMT